MPCGKFPPAKNYCATGLFGYCRVMFFKLPQQTLLKPSSLVVANSSRPSSRSSVAARSEGKGSTDNLRPIISPVRPARQSTSLPQQVAVDHSSAYILRSKRPSNAEEEVFVDGEEGADNTPFTGNALQWYLRRVDKSLDDSDAKPSAAASAYYKASQTQAGQSAVKGIGSVAGTAVSLGGKAVKAAAPVGKWALMKSLAAAGRLFTPSADKKQSKRDGS